MVGVDYYASIFCLRNKQMYQSQFCQCISNTYYIWHLQLHSYNRLLFTIGSIDRNAIHFVQIKEMCLSLFLFIKMWPSRNFTSFKKAQVSPSLHLFIYTTVWNSEGNFYIMHSFTFIHLLFSRNTSISVMASAALFANSYSVVYTLFACVCKL